MDEEDAAGRTARGTLEHELAALRRGDHVCLLYGDEAEALTAATVFVAQGLARGERCLAILGDLSRDQIVRTLAAQGVDARLEQERGTLLLWAALDAFFPPAAFDPDALIAFLRSLAQEAVAAGCAGLRIAGDLTWTRGKEMAHHERLIRFEALWNDLVATAPLVGLCLFRRDAFAPMVVRDVMRTHPLALLDGHLCTNLYYEPPSLVVDPAALDKRVDWMLAQLVRTHLAEERAAEAHDLLEQRVAERTRELTVLLEVARSLVSTLELEPLMHVILGQFRHVVEYTGATLRVVQGEELVVLAYQGPAPREQVAGPGSVWPGLARLYWQVIETRAPVIIDDLLGTSPLARAAQEGADARLSTTFRYVRSWLGVPLVLKERVLGLLSLGHEQLGYYTQQHAALLLAIASHIAVALENARLYQQGQRLAINDERARLAREMHDSLAQLLFYVNTQAEAVRTLLRTGQIARAAELSEQLAQAARAAYADVREDIQALRVTDAGSLVESLATYLPRWQEQSGVRATLLLPPASAPLPTLPPAVDIQMVRLVQEALTNVRKHAHAQRVQVRISGAEDQVIVEVEDDGLGFDPTARDQSTAPHFGLAMMRERVAAVGGHLEIDAAPGRGTRVRVQIPVEAAPRGPRSGD